MHSLYLMVEFGGQPGFGCVEIGGQLEFGHFEFGGQPKFGCVEIGGQPEFWYFEFGGQRFTI